MFARARFCALVGSYEGASGALDRVTQAHRQPGSSFKPFVYSYALYSRRFTPATMLDTNPGSSAGYRPKNFEDSEGSAPMRLREALAHSVNVAAVHVLQDVGPANVVAWANALGIQSKLGADLSLALGSYEVTPFEMAAAYATFASGGDVRGSHAGDADHRAGWPAIALPPRPPSRRVMGEAEAYLTTSLLSSVVDHGTGASARSWVAPWRARPEPATRRKTRGSSATRPTSCARRGRGTTTGARSVARSRARPPRSRRGLRSCGPLTRSARPPSFRARRG